MTDPDTQHCIRYRDSGGTGFRITLRPTPNRPCVTHYLAVERFEGDGTWVEQDGEYVSGVFIDGELLDPNPEPNLEVNNGP